MQDRTQSAFNNKEKINFDTNTKVPKIGPYCDSVTKQNNFLSLVI